MSRELLEKAAKAAGKRERHGMNKSPEHRAWVHMRQRCTNPKKKEWPHYGGRGITVCARWMSSFLAFLEDIGPRPSPKYSIDRIDVNGNYEPGNVRWATQQEQNENTRTARLVTLNGKTQSLAAWAREVGIARSQINGRLSAGWTMEEAVLTPSVPGQKIHMRAARGYSKLSAGGYRVMVDGKYIRTVKTEEAAKELVAATRLAIVRAAAAIGEAK